MPKSILLPLLLLLLTGCSRFQLDAAMSDAYQAYDEGDCARVISELSVAERASRSRPYMQPEISLLRGQCLERQKLYVDAERTYQYIVMNYPKSEYAFRAKARIETLHQLGLDSGGVALKSNPAPL